MDFRYATNVTKLTPPRWSRPRAGSTTTENDDAARDGGTTTMGRRRRDEEESEEELDDDDEELLEVGGSGSDDDVEDDDGEENDGGGSAGEVDDDDELEAEMAALEAIKRERAAKSAAGKGLKTFVNNAAGLEASLEGMLRVLGGDARARERRDERRLDKLDRFVWF